MKRIASFPSRALVLVVALASALLISPPARADFQAGMTAFQSGDYKAALEQWKPLAEAGNSDAQNALGVMYWKGLGVPQDYAEAANWYRKAADQGAAGAQSNLGVMYHRGIGVTQDHGEAAKWYRKAADQGNTVAQANLGVLYAQGRGVELDDVQAYAWLGLAAKGGFASAAAKRDTLAKRMTAEQIKQAEALIAAWKPTSPKP